MEQKSKNAALHAANRAKKDEFYTQMTDIAKELIHYRDFFAGKTVLCNCDDPYESNFFKYFALNFRLLKLKKLIATCYDSSPVAGEQLSLFRDRHPYAIEITEIPDADGNGAIDLSDVEFLLKNQSNVLRKLKSGDFRSEECIKLLKEADVVVTNPPFSLFREYVAQLIEYDKKFLIIGNKNAITYKEIFPLIIQNKMWIGYRNINQDMWFIVPEGEKFEKVVDNHKIRHIMGCWYTNIDVSKRHEDLILYKRYTPEEYPKYDNYDAINVDHVCDIPCDYFEDMGVPITFLDKHNPEQFDIIAFRKGDDGKDLSYSVPSDSQFVHVERERERERERGGGRFSRTSELSSGARCNGVMGVPITFLDKYNPDQFILVGATESEGKGFSNGLWREDSKIAQPVVNGERKFKRLFIKRKM